LIIITSKTGRTAWSLHDCVANVRAYTRSFGVTAYAGGPARLWSSYRQLMSVKLRFGHGPCGDTHTASLRHEFACRSVPSGHTFRPEDVDIGQQQLKSAPVHAVGGGRFHDSDMKAVLGGHNLLRIGTMAGKGSSRA